MNIELTTSELVIPLLIAAACVIAIIAIRFFKPMKKWMRFGLYILLAFAAVEFGIARNLIVVEQLWMRLSIDQVGFKQRDTLRVELLSREKPWDKPYVAIGSSQAWAVFGKASLEREDLGVITTAGMSPIELRAYQDVIARHRPDQVILYVSELDLRRSSSITSLKLTPQIPAGTLWDISSLMLENDQATPSEIADLWIANYVSIYRYNFVVDGLIRKVAEKVPASPASQTESPGSDDPAEETDPIQDHIDQITEGFSDESFESNLQEFDEFFIWCKAEGIGVIVVQGEYHPQAMERNRILRDQATQLISDLCDTHGHVQYVSTEQVHGFEASDYRDATHVTDDVAPDFVERLMIHLQKDMPPS